MIYATGQRGAGLGSQHDGVLNILGCTAQIARRRVNREWGERQTTDNPLRLLAPLDSTAGTQKGTGTQ